MSSCRFYASAQPEVVCAVKCLMLRQIMSIKILFKYFLCLEKLNNPFVWIWSSFQMKHILYAAPAHDASTRFKIQSNKSWGMKSHFTEWNTFSFNCRENGFIHIVYKIKLFWCLIISFYYGKVGLRGDSPLCQMLMYTAALGSLA